MGAGSGAGTALTAAVPDTGADRLRGARGDALLQAEPRLVREAAGHEEQHRERQHHVGP